MRQKAVFGTFDCGANISLSRNLDKWCDQWWESSETGKYSHHGRKYRIGIFSRRTAETGKKSWRESWRITGAKFRSEILSRSENFQILLIWSHPDWKYRIEIFGRRAAKTCKKSWRETLRTPGAKFRSKILSPGQNFRILHIWCEVPVVAPCALQSATPALWNFAPVVRKVSLHDFLHVLATLRPKISIRYFQPRCDQMIKILKFSLRESISLRNLAPVVRKFSLLNFLPVFAALRPKISIWYFRP